MRHAVMRSFRGKGEGGHDTLPVTPYQLCKNNLLCVKASCSLLQIRTVKLFGHNLRCRLAHLYRCCCCSRRQYPCFRSTWPRSGVRRSFDRLAYHQAWWRQQCSCLRQRLRLR